MALIPSFSLYKKITLASLLIFITTPFIAEANIIVPDRALGGNTATVTYQDYANGYGNNGAAYVNGYEYDITIPYIQTNNDLFIKVDNWPTADSVRFELTDMNTNTVIATDIDQSIDILDNNSFETNFNNTAFPKGEYRVDVFGVDSNGNDIPGLTDYAEHIGIGDIILAIGDSLTEGTPQIVYEADPLNPSDGVFDWTHSSLVSGTVSQDDRNFAQPGGFWNFNVGQGRLVPFRESFTTSLNDNLSSCYDYPVFILNQGWNGHNADDYLRYMGGDEWQSPVNQLGPNQALIQLGANDVFEGQTMAAFENNLDAIVTTLNNSHNIPDNEIWIATSEPPLNFSTDYTPTFAPINNVIGNQGVNTGPDFYTFGSNNMHLLSSDDIHFNQIGYEEKGREWAKVLTEGEGCDYRIANAMTVDKAVLSTDYTAGGAIAGDTITYQIEITNNSDVAITDTQVIDQLFNDSVVYPQYPGGNINDACDFEQSFNMSDPLINTVPYNELITCTVQYILTPVDIQNGFVNNSVLVESENTLSVTANENETLPQPQGAAQLSITKEIINQTYEIPTPAVNDEITYEIKVKNIGTANATNVSITDSLEGISLGTGLTCPGFAMPGTLTPSQEVVCTFTHKITTADISVGAVSNTAEVVGFDLNSGAELGDSASITASFEFTTAVDIEKNIANLNYTQLPPPVGSSTIDYEISVKNNSNYALTNFFVNDSLATASNPVSCVGFPMPGTLAVSQEITCFFTYTIQQIDVDSGYVTNEAFAEFRDNEGNDIQTDKVYKTESFDPEPSIDIKKSIKETHYSSPNPRPGDSIDYTIVITNNGNTPLNNIGLSDSLGSPICPAFPQPNNGLDPGENIECYFTYVIDSDDIDNGIVYNNATVTAKDMANQDVGPLSDMVSEKVSQNNNGSSNRGGGRRRSVRRTGPGMYTADFGPNLVTTTEIPELAVEIKPGWDRCDCGRQVKRLQEWLNQHGYIVNDKGNGSPGNETLCFGHYTEKALMRFQETYADIILHTQGRTSGDGSLDNVTAAVIAAIDLGFIPQRIPIPIEDVQGTSEREANHPIGHVPRIEY